MFKDPKTTITGICTIIVTVAAHYNIVIGPEWQAVIVATGLAILSLFAKDATKRTI
jgi:hypothetical protein